MRPNTSKGSATRQRIIMTAMRLFRERGIKGTSPETVIAEAGVGKGQLYYYFKNKAELVHQVFAAHREAITEGTSPIAHPLETWDDLEGWFRQQVDLQDAAAMSCGCPFGSAVSELSADEELLRLDLARIFDAMSEQLARFFLSEQAKGRLLAAADVDGLAEFCLASLQGAMILGKVHRDRKIADRCLTETMRHLRSYVVR